MTGFWDKVEKTDTCWLWTGYRVPEGYGRVWLDGKPKYAHRVSWRLALGEIPNGVFVCHRCDNPPCVNPAHLFLGTNAENSADRSAKGRSARQCGAHNSRAKLTEPQVREILALRQQGVSQREAAALYGISRSTVSALDCGQRWKHVGAVATVLAGRLHD